MKTSKSHDHIPRVRPTIERPATDATSTTGSTTIWSTMDARSTIAGANNYSPLHRCPYIHNRPYIHNQPGIHSRPYIPPCRTAACRGTDHHDDASPPVRRRRSIRLRGYDYTRAGAYFITICTQHRRHRFGVIRNGVMILNDAGRVADECWRQIPDHFPNVELDEWVVMPNHIHGIIVITDPVGVNDHSPLRHPSPATRPRGTSRTIGAMVRGFKIGVTAWYRRRSDTSKIWQRNYWEHIVRNEPELNRIRRYIAENPLKWDQDRLYAPDDGKQIREPQAIYGQEVWMI